MQRLTHTLRPLAVIAAAAAFLAATSAGATGRIPRDEGFMKPPPSVQNRLYSLDGKSDLAAFFAFSIKNQLTEHYGATLNYAYSFNEYFALDVLVGGGYGGLTTLAKNVRETARLSGESADLEDAGALLAHGSLGVRFTPAYGKLSLSSEIPLHFHGYFVGGVGGVLVNDNGVLTCASDLSGRVCPNNEFRSEVRPTLGFNFGGGIRFIVDQRFSARLEVRDIVYIDRWFNNVNLATPASKPGEAQSGFSHAPLVMFGLGLTL